MPKIPSQCFELSSKSSLGLGSLEPSTSGVSPTSLEKVKKKTTLLIDDSEVDENENLAGI